MEGLSNAFKDLNRWQIGFLVAVVVASFGATYGVYAFVSSSGERGLEENQRSIPVQTGNLVNQSRSMAASSFPTRRR